jgi:hypothetical protein
LQYQWPYLALAGRRDILQNQWQKTALQNGLHDGLLAITQGKNGWSIAIEVLPANTIECNSTATPENCQQLTALHKKWVCIQLNFIWLVYCIKVTDNNCCQKRSGISNKIFGKELLTT